MDVFTKSLKYLLVAYHLQFPRPGPCARATPAYPVRPEGRSSSPRIFLHLSSSVIRTDTAPRTVLGAIVTHNPYCNSQCGYVPCHTIPVGFVSSLSPLHPVFATSCRSFLLPRPLLSCSGRIYVAPNAKAVLQQAQNPGATPYSVYSAHRRVESFTRDMTVQQALG